MEQRAGLDASRVEALSDGVFAIVLTLLVFELKVPQVGPEAGSAELLAGLRALLPQVMGYLLSFFALANFWIGHRGQFHYVRRTDRALLWINFLFFLFLTAVPFVTAFLAEYPGQPLPVVVYGVDLGLAALTLYAHWRYATRDARLLDAPISPALMRQQGRRILVGPIIYLVGIACAFVNP
ncbi:MAG TPA: TMEM175 family protein [Chloroflexota bacterium]